MRKVVLLFVVAGAILALTAGIAMAATLCTPTTDIGNTSTVGAASTAHSVTIWIVSRTAGKNSSLDYREKAGT